VKKEEIGNTDMNWKMGLSDSEKSHVVWTVFHEV